MTKPLTPDDPIVGPARGDYATLLQWHERAFRNQDFDLEILSYWMEVYRLAPLVDIDPAIVVAQSALETGNWTSEHWTKRRNPAGIGVLGDPGGPEDDLGYSWKDGTDAARVHIAHLIAYIKPKGHNRSNLFANATEQYPHLIDPRWQAVIDAGWAGTVRTIRDLTGKWATDPDYHTKIAKRGNEIFAVQEDESPVDTLTFGRVKQPKFDRMIVQKPRDGAGFNFVSPNRFAQGACTHITDGDGSIEWYFEFVSTGGEREYDALWDFTIDKSGRIAMFNDPYGNRSPWASGGSNGLEGDGPAFIRTLGIDGINGAIASIEHVGKAPARMTDAQIEANAHLCAWIFDRAKVPWSSYPVNPNVGCVTDMEHWEFATKGCPGSGMRGQTNARQDRTRAILKAAQEGESQPQIPPPDPVTNPGKQYPAGLDKEKATEFFGTLTRHNANGKDSKHKFDENGIISNAWLERGAKENKFPKADEWFLMINSNKTKRQLVTFQGGWALIDLADRSGWHWVN